jgi:hypothetical protein
MSWVFYLNLFNVFLGGMNVGLAAVAARDGRPFLGTLLTGLGVALIGVLCLTGVMG